MSVGAKTATMPCGKSAPRADSPKVSMTLTVAIMYYLEDVHKQGGFKRLSFRNAPLQESDLGSFFII